MTMDREEGEESASELEAALEKIPKDFPRPARLGCLPGAQPKYLANKYKGRFYLAGCTPPEIYQRWEICETLAVNVSERSADSKLRNSQQVSDVEILNLYLIQLIKLSWTSVEESRWIIRRAAQILCWPIPKCAQFCAQISKEGRPYDPSV